MERKEREAILRQGVVRPETPRDRAEREALETDLIDSPVVGQPLRQRLRNFRPSSDAAVRAIGGPLAWMRRLREIELRIAEHEARLAEARELLRAEYDGDTAGFARAWQALAQSWSFSDVNELIERHNRNFPAEARLPMNPRTGDFVTVNGRPYTREPLDARWILARFAAR
ncbi:MAG TPA: hypothetical protein VE736_01960 [Gaiellaceae bacterium]|jgi:hypothetical protein|nr:hypothetical protein [Gaiellaceae bacterium]